MREAVCLRHYNRQASGTDTTRKCPSMRLACHSCLRRYGYYADHPAGHPASQLDSMIFDAGPGPTVGIHHGCQIQVISDVPPPTPVYVRAKTTLHKFSIIKSNEIWPLFLDHMIFDRQVSKRSVGIW